MHFNQDDSIQRPIKNTKGSPISSEKSFRIPIPEKFDNSSENTDIKDDSVPDKKNVEEIYKPLTEAHPFQRQRKSHRDSIRAKVFKTLSFYDDHVNHDGWQREEDKEDDQVVSGRQRELPLEDRGDDRVVPCCSVRFATNIQWLPNLGHSRNEETSESSASEYSIFAQ
ncbi:hypothetical protein CDAR_410071 [Caerostris darwini]|uniref:Uncharacterized protein n=1 Tax=Caerostris darwini TaxID=1538125 RepID=A0AAV4VVT5_9ARAC|nr:hypothetical protein CDAR_410071 [Caerostris darwini]